MLRPRLAAALVALAASAASASPASAGQQTYTAKLDCGSGPIVVKSGKDLFAPLVDRRGHRYYPVAWNVKVNGKAVKARKPGKHHGATVRCSYDDGTAVGTVTVQKPAKRQRSKHRH
jgi:hypothetical protein